MKIIYIQDDRTAGTVVQFCYSEDMEMLDRWIESSYGEGVEVFHSRWESVGVRCNGIRNLKTRVVPLLDFISMCETLGYIVKRVCNELTRGNEFKDSCIKMYPEDFQ